MNIVYLHRLVCEELDGAREYIMKAQRIKEDNPTFAKTFSVMSGEELNHAAKLFDMIKSIIEDQKKDASDDACAILDELYEVIADDYDERWNMVKSLHADFNR